MTSTTAQPAVRAGTSLMTGSMPRSRTYSMASSLDLEEELELMECDAEHCSHLNPTFKCEQCRGYYYCSPTCQRKAWLEHKKECVHFDNMAAALYSMEETVPVDPVVDELAEYYNDQTLNDFDTAVSNNASNNEGVPLLTAATLSHEARRLVRDLVGAGTEGSSVAATRLTAPGKDQLRTKYWQPVLDQLLPFANTDQGASGENTDLSQKLRAIRAVAQYLYQSGQWQQSLDMWNDMYQNELARIPANLANTPEGKEEDVPLPGGGGRTVTRGEYITQEGFDQLSLRWLDDFDRRMVMQILNGQAEAYLGLQDWQSAMRLYHRLLDITKMQVGDDDEEQKKKRMRLTEYNLALSHCLRETGDPQGALDAAQEAIDTFRYRHDGHKVLALAYKALGDIEQARRVMIRALSYEEPWNDVNRKKNKDYYDELCIEIRRKEELRLREEAFMVVWGDAVNAANAYVRDEGISWTEVKKSPRFDMFGATETVEDVDEKDQLEETKQIMDDAVKTALAGGGNEEEAESDEAKVAAVSQDLPTSSEMDTSTVSSGDLDQFEDAHETHDEGAPSANINQSETIAARLGKDVLKWLKHSDSKFRQLFSKKLERLAEGPHGRKYVKPLVGCKNKIYETYLEQKSGQRILWTDFDSESILIWNVVKHKDVNRYMKLIDDALTRSDRPVHSTMLLDKNEDMVAADVDVDHEGPEDRILLDPMGDTPLKVYDIRREDINRLDSISWQPPLHLTKEEKRIVETEGTILLLGRSGTGKTCCISNRIDRDRHCVDENSPSFKQLFIARSQRVCVYVEETVGGEFGSDGKRLYRTNYWTFGKLVRVCEEGDTTYADKTKQVDFNRFKHEIVAGQNLDTDPLILWTQIRTFIKGSIEAVQLGRALTKEEYMAIGTRRCRLTPEQREVSYAAFELYDKYMKAEKLWDDCDRIAALVKRLRDDYEMRYRLSVSNIYVDEVQDYTQAELALFYLLSGSDGLFFAGDPAQSVVEGVEFRFEDLREVAYCLFPDDPKKIPKKPLTVNVNFRSHAGVLNVASAILERLFAAFPGSAKELKKDEGLFRGPRPGVFMDVEESMLKELVYKIEGVVLLTMNDKDVDHLQKLVGERVVVLSIRDSKGLEFTDVIIVDFFKGMSAEHQKMWRKLLQGKENEEEIMPELETHVKQLYTAITRCTQRLFFAETASPDGRSDAGSAFLRFCTDPNPVKFHRHGPIAAKQAVTDVSKMVKTNDEWSSMGIDYAVNSESAEDTDKQKYWLERAIDCFERGEDTKLGAKAQAHHESIDFRTKPTAEFADMDPEELEADVANLLGRLIQEKLTLESRRLCEKAVPLLEEQTGIWVTEKILPRLPEVDA